jgi:hypothetical protein
LRAGNAASALLLAAIVAAAGTRVSAHRYDEYLQASRIAIAPAVIRLDVSLTPGIAVADAVIRDIDANHDAVLSTAECTAYLQHVLRGLSLRLDDGPVPLTLTGSSVPAAAALRAGDAAITLLVDARLVQPAPGAHRLSFRNANAAHGAVYLANALLPDDDRVAITGMTHAVDQSGLTVAYSLRPVRDWSWLWLGLFGKRA